MSAEALTAGPTSPPGPVLKADQAASWLDGFAFRDAARKQADALVADTQRAYDDKRREGFETGLREGAGAAAELLARTTGQVDAYFASLEGELADLALSIVRRVAGETPAPEFVARLASEAIAGFRREQRLVVTVAPENYDELRRRLGLHDPVFGERLTLSTDASLGPLDCRVSSPYATVDAGLDAQLDAVRRELVDGTPKP